MNVRLRTKYRKCVLWKDGTNEFHLSINSQWFYLFDEESIQSLSHQVRGPLFHGGVERVLRLCDLLGGAAVELVPSFYAVSVASPGDASESLSRGSWVIVAFSAAIGFTGVVLDRLQKLPKS